MNDLYQLLASTYSLALKLQSCHWNVSGHNFITLHKLFQDLYNAAQDNIDLVAEIMIMRREKVQVSFNELASRSIIDSSIVVLDWSGMVQVILNDYNALADLLNVLIKIHESKSDFVAVDSLTSQLRDYEKNIWVLSAMLQKH